MPESKAVGREFVRQVRNALAHLYDYVYLQTHPLAALVDPTRDLDRVSRGQKLRRLLLDCIETLRPQELDSARPEAARAHSMLTFRYVDGVPVKEIATLRALGQRQVYRELERSVEAVAGVLYDRLRQEATGLQTAGAVGEALSDPLQTAQAEVARLRENLHIEMVDLGDVLQGALQVVQPISKRAGVRIVVEPRDAWPPVLADRIMLRQALLNLLTHALHALSLDSLTIALAATGSDLRLEISESGDTGRHRPLSSPTTGHDAVSLPVGEALLVAQGGRLETRRQDGRWQASVMLPTSAQVTILVIDDNRDLVALLQRYLAGHDVNVVAALDAEQALRLAAETQPRLITLDVMMPGQDGWEILQKLKAAPRTRHIPVIICSVLNVAEIALTMGASGYISKPVSQTDLLRELRRWLGPLPPAQ